MGPFFSRKLPWNLHNFSKVTEVSLICFWDILLKCIIIFYSTCAERRAVAWQPMAWWPSFRRCQRHSAGRNSAVFVLPSASTWSSPQRPHLTRSEQHREAGSCVEDLNGWSRTATNQPTSTNGNKITPLCYLSCYEDTISIFQCLGQKIVLLLRTQKNPTWANRYALASRISTS